MNSDQLWQTALAQLRMQMTEATFDSWVKDTRFVSHENDEVVIATKSVFAKDWLENRLFSVVKRTTENVFGKNVEVRFVLDVPSAGPLESDLQTDLQGDPPGGRTSQEGIPQAGIPQKGTSQEDRPELIQPDQTDEPLSFADAFARNTDFYSIKMDMGFWLPELQYDNLFWAPYLGNCWSFYRHLLMHWTRSVRTKKDKHLLDMTRPENHCFTPPFRLSYRKATRWLGKKNYKIIPGGIYECHRSGDMHRVGLRLTQCQECHDPHDWQPESGGGRCYYWREGLLHRLFDERLLAIQISSTNRAKIQIWRTLGLLTPWQVGQLNSMLQDQHENWLERFGHKFGITFDEWLEIDYRYMAAHRNDYDTGQLAGEPPENPFLQPHGRENGREAKKRDHVVAKSEEKS